MPPDGRRILVLANFFTQGHGGTPESVLLLARALADCGVVVDVFCDKGLLRNVGGLDTLPAADADAAFSANRPDVKSYAALFVAGSWNRRAPLIALCAAWGRVPITYAAKGCLCRMEFERLRDARRIPYLLLVEVVLLALARIIIFSSRVELRASVLPRWLWQRRAAMLPEVFCGGQAGPDMARADVVTLGFLAEISPRKGLYELIDGVGHYLATRPDAKIILKIAGPVRRGSEGYIEECRALAARNGAAACIEWCTPVRGAQRQDFYRSLDLFICPSRFESFGLTPLEALWQGVAVCAAPAMGVLEFLRDDAPVLRMSGLGKQDIAAAIAEAAENIDAWREHARAWKGHHSLMQTNAQIAKDFARILLDGKPA
jgi:glycosyltransferase involved in cell wall biosynthesis